MEESLMLLVKGGFHRTANFLRIVLALTLLCSVTADKAQAASSCIPGPGDRPETGVNGGVPGFERQPPDGFQGFWCGVRKVGQHALYNRGSFGDLQVIVDDRGHCAYASMRDPSDLA